MTNKTCSACAKSMKLLAKDFEDPRCMRCHCKELGCNSGVGWYDDKDRLFCSYNCLVAYPDNQKYRDLLVDKVLNGQKTSRNNSQS